MFNKIQFLILFLFAVINAQQLSSPQQAINKINNNFFIQNKGQWDPEVKYLAQIGGMNAWITNSGVVYDYYRIRKNPDNDKTTGDAALKKMMNPKEMREFENRNTTIEGNIIRMQLVNAEKGVTSIGNNKLEGYYNYFIGNDKSKWASFVPLYENIEIQGVYKNIDVKYYYDNGMLRYDYKAKPGADISQIKFRFDGQQGISINPNGELVLKTSVGEVTNGKIYAYQMDGENKKEVECKFEQNEDGTIGLKAENFNANKELIIDPLVYSIFIGGNQPIRGYSIAVDTSGNAYITGITFASNYPTTIGAYQTTFSGDIIKYSSNVFVTKLNSSGTYMIYSTFIGGSIIGNHTNYETAESITIDTSGNAFITGMTYSLNYPTTAGAYQSDSHGDTTYANAFVTKINSTGTNLIYSTYIGGNNMEEGRSIAVDAGGNAYITGYTCSSNFPITNGAFQTILGNDVDAFVTKLNSTGTALIYSTFIGGDKGEDGYSIRVDVNENAYITGNTNSTNYPTTSGAYQNTGIGIFITKLNSKGNGLVYSTLINNGSVSSLALDKSMNAYITGCTSSPDYPITSGAYQTTLGSIYGVNAFITKLNSTGSDLIYSTLIGGNNNDVGYSIGIDSSDNAYITGLTNSINYPTTINAYQTNLGSYYDDVFITKLNSTGNRLLYSSYIGGNSNDVGYSIGIESSGNAYIIGTTISSNYPTTNGSYILGGDYIGTFITKFNLSTETSVQSNNPSIPSKFELSQNYPNPFNPNTTISYALPFSSNVKIEVYNILGQKVRELLNGQKNAGYYEVNFNTTGLASGVYLYMIEAKSLDGKNEYKETKKMVLLK